MLTKSYEELKGRVIEQMNALCDAAQKTGMQTLAMELRTQRIPKIQKDQFSIVVLGEFNHGKSTFVNALLGSSVLPVGITPTTATINHVVYSEVPYARATLLDGSTYDVDPSALYDWVTVDGANNDQVRYVEVGIRAPLLSDHVQLVDTPGVNDINETRAEITYQYIPQADLVLFLLDANQILKQSERLFLQEKLLRRSKDKLLFVVGKSDLLTKDERAAALAYCKKHLSPIVEDPMLFPVSAKRYLAGDVADSGFPELEAYLREHLSKQKGALLLDHAVEECLRLVRYVRQNVGMRKRAFELSVAELEQKIANIRKEFIGKQQTLRQIKSQIDAEIAAMKAKAKLDVEEFATFFCEHIPGIVDKAPAHDIELYFQGFLQHTMKTWVEAEGEEVAKLLEKFVEQVLQVTHDNLQETMLMVGAELGIPVSELFVSTGGVKYDVGLFALGALGTGIYLFVNTFVGGLLTLAAPVLGVLVRAWVGGQIKVQAKAQGVEMVRRTMDMMAPKFGECFDEVAEKLRDFVDAAGQSLYQGISEVLERALEERTLQGDGVSSKEHAFEEQMACIDTIELQCEEIQKALWTS